jgi:protocatechuate 3,4-dioxygenase beta subunit
LVDTVHCNPLTGYNIELWHCDAAGHFSEYSQPGFDGTGLTFLRGVQTTDFKGQVTFTSVYPGWYAGRATHMYVRVFRGTTLLKTTQLAFPEDVSQSVYAVSPYAANGPNPTTNAADPVFGDGIEQQLVRVGSGNPRNGYPVTHMIPIAI